MALRLPFLSTILPVPRTLLSLKLTRLLYFSPPRSLSSSPAPFVSSIVFLGCNLRLMLSLRFPFLSHPSLRSWTLPDRASWLPLPSSAFVHSALDGVAIITVDISTVGRWIRNWRNRSSRRRSIHPTTYDPRSFSHPLLAALLLLFSLSHSLAVSLSMCLSVFVCLSLSFVI